MNRRERTVAGDIAREVKRARAVRGWSQADLAERLDLSVNYVSLLERAERIPSVEVLVRLAATLGTTVGAMVGETTDGGDPWATEALVILRALAPELRPAVLGMLRGAQGAVLSPPGGSRVRSSPGSVARRGRRGPP